MSVFCTPLTDDTLFDGQLICRQYRQGYRFSIDAILAAHFCKIQHGDHILDLGCGCGVIGLVTVFRNREKGIHVTGLELQSDLAMLAQDNVLANNMYSDFSVVEGDLRHIGDYFSPEFFDLVVCNPPYRKHETGRISLGDQKARARHEIDTTLRDMAKAMAFTVKNRGKIVIIYPAVRLVPLVSELKKNNLEPKRIQPVYSYPGQMDASLVLIEAVKNGGEEIQFMPPFYIYTEKNGPYTEAAQKLYDE